MAIENEKSVKISDEDLSSDIILTEKELLAYQKLTDGYNVLCRLPENIQSGRSGVYAYESLKFSSLAEECEKFLIQLRKLQVERSVRIK